MLTDTELKAIARTARNRVDDLNTIHDDDTRAAIGEVILAALKDVRDRSQPAPLSADERAETLRILEPFAAWVSTWTIPPPKGAPLFSRYPSITYGQVEAAASLYQRLGEAGEPTDSEMLEWLFEDCIDRKVYLRHYDEETGERVYLCCCQQAATPRDAVRAAMKQKRGDS